MVVAIRLAQAVEAMILLALTTAAILAQTMAAIHLEDRIAVAANRLAPMAATSHPAMTATILVAMIGITEAVANHQVQIGTRCKSQLTQDRAGPKACTLAGVIND